MHSPSRPENIQGPAQVTFATALSALIDTAASNGLGSSLLHEILGDGGLEALNQGNPAGALRATRRAAQSGSSSTQARARLVELFVLREGAELVEWAELLGEELRGAAVANGLLTPFPGVGHLHQLAVDIRPYAFPHLVGREDRDESVDVDFLLASDPDASLWPTNAERGDHVPGIGNAPRSLLRSIPPSGNSWLPAPRRVLDLGCGGGALSLALATAFPGSEILGTDISERALGFARANAQQFSGRDGRVPVFAEGSWFEPVAGQRFDMIVSNPPFVVQPPEVEHVYRDSGLELDGATEKVISGCPEHLSPGGTAHILSAWAVTEADSVASKMNRWLPAEGIRASVLVREYVSPETYVSTWLHDESIDPRSPEGRRKAEKWLNYLGENEVLQIALGFSHMQAISGSTEITVEHLPEHMVPGTPLGQDVAEGFARSAWLEGAAPEEILEERYALRPGVAITNVRCANTQEGMGFEDFALRISRSDGPAWQHEIDGGVERILAGLSPEGLSLRDVIGLYAAVTPQPESSTTEDEEEWAARLERDMVPIIVDLVRHGIVLPAGLTELAAGEALADYKKK